MGGDSSHGTTVTKNYQGIRDMMRKIKCEVRKEEKNICCMGLEFGFREQMC